MYVYCLDYVLQICLYDKTVTFSDLQYELYIKDNKNTNHFIAFRNEK